MMRHSTEIRVRYAETDQMRRAYHANYLVWFEAARINMLREHDLAYHRFEREGYFLPVVEAHIYYRGPALFDELIRIDASIKEKPRAKIYIEYEVFNSVGQLITTGNTLHTFMDSEGRPVKPPKIFTEKMNHYF